MSTTIPTDYLYSIYSGTTKLEYNISLQIRKTAEWKVLPEKEHIVHARTAFQNSNIITWDELTHIYNNNLLAEKSIGCTLNSSETINISSKNKQLIITH